MNKMRNLIKSSQIKQILELNSVNEMKIVIKGICGRVEQMEENK